MVEEEKSPEEIANSPTLTMQATRAGIILGTAAYMSPEQAKGRAADHRADIWSFGAVLYEMLTGRQPFSGDDITKVMASVVKVDLDWEALPSKVPAVVKKWLHRCLRADPKERYHAIADIRLDIEDSLNNPEAETQIVSFETAVPFWKLPAVWATVAVSILLSALAWYLMPRSEAPLIKTTITADRLQLFPAPPVISPDGRRYKRPVLEPGLKMQLPVALDVGCPVDLELSVSDDLQRWDKVGRVHEALLRVRVINATERDRVVFRLNGKKLAGSLLRKINQTYRMRAPRYRTGSGYWLVYHLDREHWPMTGKNSLQITLTDRDPDVIDGAYIRDVEMEIKYLMGKNFHRGQDPVLGPTEPSGI